jgi:flagellar motor protein MotB
VGMVKSKDKKTILSYSDNTPLYTSNIWVTTLADLYLVLLVFFIMLNNISSADKIREKKAVDSINQSFSKSNTSNDAVIQILDFPTILANYLNSIEGIMNGAFKPDELNINRSGNKMIVRFPADTFFEAGQAVIKDKHRKFFKSLTDILLQKTIGIKVGTDIIIESKAFSDSSLKGSYQIDMDRAKILADKLISSGVSSDEISRGISFGSGDNIVMKFTIVDINTH